MPRYHKESYTYDAVGNIETISENGELKAKYYYDELSQLVREDNKELNQTIVYEYDQGGNIQSKTRYAYTEGELGEAVGTDTYSYQAEDLWADVLTGYNGQKFTYDEIGNPLTYRDGMGFTWQYGRQMSGAVTEEEAIGYWYNADGIRTKKIRSNGEVTDYYLNGSNIITMITNSVMDPENPKRLDFYYDQNSMLIGFMYNGQDYWYIRNGQNDIAGILDSTGTQVVSYTYDSWGVPISTTGSMAKTIGEINPFRYRGYYYDSETGLYYLNSRYYDPVVGRLISIDDESLILASPDELTDKNLFSYCDNNPIIRADTEGEFWNFVIGAAVGALSVYVGDVISNIVSGETGWDILKPTSSLGTYIGSAVSGMIPGAGIASTVARPLVNTAVQCTVDVAILKKEVSVRDAAISLTTGIIGEGLTRGTSRLLNNSRPQNYSSFRNQMTRRIPSVSRNQTQQLMQFVNKAVTATVKTAEVMIAIISNIKIN